MSTTWMLWWTALLPGMSTRPRCHPGRGCTGREQVRTNCRQIFAGVPDLRAVLLRLAVAANTVWSEWEMTGTRRDGLPHLMRGVILFGVSDGRAE